MVRLHGEVALDVGGGERAGAVGEQRVDVIPRQEGPVEATGHRVFIDPLAEHRRHAGEHPRRRCRDIDAVLGTLEVVNVRRIVLHIAIRAGNEVGKLAGERDLRRSRAVQQRQLVEHAGEPLALGLPVDIDAPQGVVQRFGTHDDLRREGLFAEVLQRTAYLEILRELVLPVDAEHTLTLHTVVGVALQRHVDRRAGIDDALVQDGHLAGRIVNSIVAALAQDDTAGSDHHRALRHIVGPERDDVGRRALELAHQLELVLVGHLAGGGTRGVVELLEHVFGGNVGSHATADEELAQRASEGLGRGEEHTAVAHGVALDEVEVAVGVGLVVIVQTVAAQSAQQGGALGLRLGDIADIDTGRVALYLDVEAELLLLYV